MKDSFSSKIWYQILIYLKNINSISLEMIMYFYHYNKKISENNHLHQYNL